jgi:TRAP-type uncharacterized transport system substrate-binding protein
MKKLALVVVLVMAFVVPSFADNALTLATGDQKATYAKMCKNIMAFCPVVKEYTETTGGFDNLNLLLTRQVNMGMVPEDVLEMAKRTDTNVAKRVRGLVALHFNTLHIVILKNGGNSGGGGWLSKLGIGKEEKHIIQDLRDLRGKKVACHGSSIVTGEFLNERLQAGLVLVRVKTPSEGQAMLKSGEAVALFATAGWPVGWIDNLDPNIFTLASLDESYVKKLGEPYKLVKLNYPKLGAMGVISAGPRNVIAVWNYKSKSKVAQIMDFKRCLIENLQDIKEMDGSHPSWGDVEDVEDFTWLKYEPGAPAAPASALK